MNNLDAMKSLTRDTSPLVYSTMKPRLTVKSLTEKLAANAKALRLAFDEKHELEEVLRTLRVKRILSTLKIKRAEILSLDVRDVPGIKPVTKRITGGYKSNPWEFVPYLKKLKKSRRPKYVTYKLYIYKVDDLISEKAISPIPFLRLDDIPL